MSLQIERRRQTRHPHTCAVSTVSPEGLSGPTGDVVDFSERGVGVIVDRALEPFSVMPWRLHLKELPSPVPVLAQVRWVEPRPDGGFRVGLLFVA